MELFPQIPSDKIVHTRIYTQVKAQLRHHARTMTLEDKLTKLARDEETRRRIQGHLVAYSYKFLAEEDLALLGETILGTFCQ